MKPDEALMMGDQHNTLLLPRIERRIQVIRGLRVILDVDLAALYGVQFKRLTERWSALGSDTALKVKPVPQKSCITCGA